jgi:hypothetical protein
MEDSAAEPLQDRPIPSILKSDHLEKGNYQAASLLRWADSSSSRADLTLDREAHHACADTGSAVQVLLNIFEILIVHS